jgi:ribosome biogenesis GTPase / thiamine phosphate phosphatase
MLTEYGWNSHFQNAYDEAGIALPAARITAAHGALFRVMTAGGPCTAEISGRLMHCAGDATELPVTGDWVYLAGGEGADHALIYALLPRRTALMRKKPGADAIQVLAANVDVLVIVTALDDTYSVSRIERFLSLAREGGIEPILAFNKTDAADGLDFKKEEIAGVFPGIRCVWMSAISGDGIGELSGVLVPGETSILAGPSGAGKSTILNRLLGGEFIRTGPVREEDGKGRHTTTARELFVIPGGAIIIDTPGLREVGIWADADGVDDLFDDISALGAGCRFGDCTHTVEPGCAVREALAAGRLDERRYANYMKMRGEVRENQRSPRWRSISKEIKRFYEKSDKYR